MLFCLRLCVSLSDVIGVVEDVDRWDSTANCRTIMLTDPSIDGSHKVITLNGVLVRLDYSVVCFSELQVEP